MILSWSIVLEYHETKSFQRLFYSGSNIFQISRFIQNKALFWIIDSDKVQSKSYEIGEKDFGELLSLWLMCASRSEFSDSAWLSCPRTWTSCRTVCALARFRFSILFVSFLLFCLSASPTRSSCMDLFLEELAVYSRLPVPVQVSLENLSRP